MAASGDTYDVIPLFDLFVFAADIPGFAIGITCTGKMRNLSVKSEEISARQEMLSSLKTYHESTQCVQFELPGTSTIYTKFCFKFQYQLIIFLMEQTYYLILVCLPMLNRLN